MQIVDESPTFRLLAEAAIQLLPCIPNLQAPLTNTYFESQRLTTAPGAGATGAGATGAGTTGAGAPGTGATALVGVAVGVVVGVVVGVTVTGGVTGVVPEQLLLQLI